MSKNGLAKKGIDLSLLVKEILWDSWALRAWASGEERRRTSRERGRGMDGGSIQCDPKQLLHKPSPLSGKVSYMKSVNKDVTCY